MRRKNVLTEYGRRLAAWLCAVVVAVGFAACDKDGEKRIDFGGLPNNAQAFIETYFAHVGISSVIREKDDGRTSYDVLLSDGTDIEFNSSGEWTGINCFFSPLPSGILMSAITDKIEELHPGATVHGVDKEIGGYKVEILDNGIEWEMYFSAQGVFGREVQGRFD